MVQRHISMRGEVIDMNRLRAVNAETPALGNASLNARGDIIGKNGIILKTQEQIEGEWAANKKAREDSVKAADIKSEPAVQIPVPPVIPQAKQLLTDDQDFDPKPGEAVQIPRTASRRRITDTDQ